MKFAAMEVLWTANANDLMPNPLHPIQPTQIRAFLHSTGKNQRAYCINNCLLI